MNHILRLSKYIIGQWENLLKKHMEFSNLSITVFL